MIDKYSVTIKENSAKDTKNVLIIAGVHGDEIGTISLAYDLIHVIRNMDRLNLLAQKFPFLYKLTIIPVANYEGMRIGKRDVVHINNDMNRGWDTSRYASEIRQEIIDEIERADVVIDMHSSENCDSMLYINSNDENHRKVIGFAEHLGLHYCVTNTKNDTIKSFVNTIPNKIGITWEQKGLGKVYPALNLLTQNNIMDILKNIGEIDKHELSENKEVRNSISICNSAEGLFQVYYETGDVIERNAVIGSIIDMMTGKIIDRMYNSNTQSRIITTDYCQYAKKGNAEILLQPI
jgi:predicted deacylase